MIFADIYITPVQADRKAAYLDFSKKVAASTGSTARSSASRGSARSCHRRVTR